MMMQHFFTAFLFALSTAATSRMTAPSGAIVVAKSGGKYNTLSKAVAALSKITTSTQTLFIEEGTYNEQVYIPGLKGELIIYGQTEDTSSYASNLVTITNNIRLSSVSDDDETATLRNYAANSKIYNINIANTHGKGEQALALSVYATDQGYYGCKLTGYQDNVLAQTGNRQVRDRGDFIFGQHGTAWFDSCDIRVLAASYGTITASGRSSSSDTSFYVINKSRIAAASSNSVTKGAYYLGRPWSEYARVVFQYTVISRVDRMVFKQVDVYLGEYANTGAGASGSRASFAKKLGSPVAITTILGSNYKNWVDTSYLA